MSESVKKIEQQAQWEVDATCYLHDNSTLNDSHSIEAVKTLTEHYAIIPRAEYEALKAAEKLCYRMYEGSPHAQWCRLRSLADAEKGAK